jgi:hypothetical protein
MLSLHIEVFLLGRDKFKSVINALKDDGLHNQIVKVNYRSERIGSFFGRPRL